MKKIEKNEIEKYFILKKSKNIYNFDPLLSLIAPAICTAPVVATINNLFITLGFENTL